MVRGHPRSPSPRLADRSLDLVDDPVRESRARLGPGLVCSRGGMDPDLGKRPSNTMPNSPDSVPVFPVPKSLPRGDGKPHRRQVDGEPYGNLPVVSEPEEGPRGVAENAKGTRVEVQAHAQVFGAVH